MKRDRKRDRDIDAPLTAWERAIGGLAILAAFAAVWLLASLVCGCVSENTGSSVVVGEQMALPQITDSSDSIAVNVYESIKGARVWTAKDSKVTINYANAYTNTYFGIVETQDSMALKVIVEPLEVGGGKNLDGAASTP